MDINYEGLIGFFIALTLVVGVWVIVKIKKWVNGVNHAVYDVNSSFRGNEALLDKIHHMVPRATGDCLDARIAALEKRMKETATEG